jgi:hypothetical protein
MVDSNSNTLRNVMKADMSLGKSGAYNCWTRQIKDAFGDLQNDTVPQVSHAPTPFLLIHLRACSTRRETDAEWGMHRPMAMPARRWNCCTCNA